METEMTVDGKKTGVKLDVDLNYIFKTVIVALVLGCGTLMWSANDKLNTLASQAEITNYKLGEMEKKTSNFITIEQVNQMGKLRDLQFTTFEAKIDALSGRMGALENRFPMAPPHGVRVSQ